MILRTIIRLLLKRYTYDQIERALKEHHRPMDKSIPNPLDNQFQWP